MSYFERDVKGARWVCNPPDWSEQFTRRFISVVAATTHFETEIRAICAQERMHEFSTDYLNM